MEIEENKNPITLWAALNVRMDTSQTEIHGQVCNSCMRFLNLKVEEMKCRGVDMYY